MAAADVNALITGQEMKLTIMPEKIKSKIKLKVIINYFNEFIKHVAL